MLANEYSKHALHISMRRGALWIFALQLVSNVHKREDITNGSEMG